jgi:hypothetical protein
MLGEPFFQTLPIELTRGNFEHQSFLLVRVGGDLEAVQDKKDFHRGVRDPLVAVQKGMVQARE